MSRHTDVIRCSWQKTDSYRLIQRNHLQPCSRCCKAESRVIRETNLSLAFSRFWRHYLHVPQECFWQTAGVDANIAQADRKVRKKLTFLWKLACTTLGASQGILKQKKAIHQVRVLFKKNVTSTTLKTKHRGTIRTHTEYGSQSQISKCSTKYKIKACLWLMDEWNRLVNVIENVTAIPPISQGREENAMRQAAKYKYLPDHSRIWTLNKWVYQESSAKEQFHTFLQRRINQYGKILGQANSPLGKVMEP